MRSFIALTGLLSLVACSATPSSEVLESLREIPQGWTLVGDPSPDKLIQLRIAMEHQGQEEFEQTLMAVSTPDHPDYGQHLEREELKRMLKPKDESTAAVLEWLDSYSINLIENDGEWINFVATVHQAEALLSTKFGVYHHNVNGVDRIRTLQYSVPQNISSHLSMIQPTTRFGQIKAQGSTLFDKVITPAGTRIPAAKAVPTVELNVTACNSTITPDCLRALYNIGDYTADPACGSKLGVCGYLEQYAKFDDLEAFIDKYAPYAAGANFSYTLINGGLDLQTNEFDDGEANLDIQYTVPLAYETNVTYYSTGGRGLLVPDLDQPTLDDNENEPYLDFLTYMLKLPNSELPQTITTSYGEDEQSVPEKYARNVCNMFGQLGARGVSILFSSGDTGVGSACQTNDGKNTTRFLPIFPAACPYVTSVGGTYHVQPEIAIAFSSGGFSDLWSRPWYQAAAVPEYLSILGDRWKGLYNPNGRGFPDVAAQGYHFHVIDKNKTSGIQGDYLYSGTSASSPAFASVVSLLNNARLSAKLPPLGFLNPWIYTIGKFGLTDIVAGGSKGCTGKDVYSGLPTPFVPYASWNATKGWDPVTGYGTPNFKKLLELSTPGAKWRSIPKPPHTRSEGKPNL